MNNIFIEYLFTKMILKVEMVKKEVKRQTAYSAFTLPCLETYYKKCLNCFCWLNFLWKAKT